ncbi:MAG: MIP family channel protein [Actinomycetota bacterium]
MESIGKAAVAEFIATFTLIFIGAGAVIVGGQAGLVGIALAHGLVLAIMVSILAHISGGAVNPAVAIGLWVTGKLETHRTVIYIVAEVAGAIAGAFLLKLIIPTEIFDGAKGGTPQVVDLNGFGVGKAVLLEAVLTFFLVFAVYGTAVDDRGPFSKTAGLTIGLVLTFDILMGGPFTGAAMNPARSLGPALVSGAWTDWWVYWVGPIAGGIIAGVVYWGVFLRAREPATP